MTPVIAWKIVDGVADPVTPELPVSHYGVLCPDGRVIDNTETATNGVYVNLEQWLAATAKAMDEENERRKQA